MKEISISNNVNMQVNPPILNMKLRMGEATAGLLAVPILKSAASMLANMGTIQDILNA